MSSRECGLDRGRGEGGLDDGEELSGAEALQRRDLGWIVGCGFFGMAAYQLLLNRAERHVPAGTASIIIAAAPLVSVAVARALFDEHISKFTIAGSAACLTGVTLVCLARAGVSLSASVWTVVAAMVVQGIYHPLQRPLLHKYRGVEVATYCLVAGIVLTLPAVPLGWTEMTHASARKWMAAVYLGLFPSALGFVLWRYTVSHLQIAVATSLLYLVPPVVLGGDVDGDAGLADLALHRAHTHHASELMRDHVVERAPHRPEGVPEVPH